jgi:hypothetical protein
MYVLIFFSELAVCALSLVATAEVYLVMGVGDYCMSPIKYLNGPIVGSKAVQNIMEYYTSCALADASPFQKSVDSIDSALRVFLDALGTAALAAPAECSSEFAAAQAILVAALQSNVAIEDTSAGCKPLYLKLRGLVLDGVCGVGFSGLYKAFMSHLLSSSCLFALMVLASMLYPYFGRDGGWSMTRKSVHATDELERELTETGKRVVVEIHPTLPCGRSLGRSTRVGVNPTLTQLDHDPFRDPLDDKHWDRISLSQVGGESKEWR